MLLTTFFTTYEVTNMELVLNKDPSNFYISKNGERVLYYYPGYREEQQMFQKTKHYGELWRERNIYIKDSKNIYNV
jgi:flavoprotein